MPSAVLSHVFAPCSHMSPRCAVTCLRAVLSHVPAQCCHTSPRSAVLSHVFAPCCHLSPRRAVTSLRAVLSHVPAPRCHMSSRRAVTCLRAVLSHVPAACCYMFSCRADTCRPSEITVWNSFEIKEFNVDILFRFRIVKYQLNFRLRTLVVHVPRRAVTCLRAAQLHVPAPRCHMSSHPSHF